MTMTLLRLVVLAALLYPAATRATSCGIHVVVVNHRSYAVTVQLKSFDMDRSLQAPLPEDFDKPVHDGVLRSPLSSLEQVDIPAGNTVDVRFRRICVGDFWLNWRVVSATGEINPSGQLRPHDGQSIDIR